jgi:hypothetical protein
MCWSDTIRHAKFRVIGNLIIGLDRATTGTLVERTTRFTMLLHLPAWTAGVSSRESRTARHWPAAVLRLCMMRSPRRSRPCPSNRAQSRRLTIDTYL